MQDLLERGDGLGLLDLRDHAGGRAVLADDRLQVADVGGGADERERDEIDAHAEREGEVVEILLRQRRDRDRDTGQVDPLVGADRAADDDAAARTAVHDLLDGQAHEPVVDQDVVPRPQDLADHRRRDRQLVTGRDLLADDQDLLVLDQRRVAVRSPIRSFGPCRSAISASGLFVSAWTSRTTSRPVGVILVVAVGQVEADRVDAGVDELADRVVRRRDGADRRDDLRSAANSCHAAQTTDPP